MNLEKFEQQGYEFFQDWTMDAPITPERIVLPTGEIKDIDELEALGDKEALHYYDLVREMNVSERCRRYPSSFRDKEDVRQCKTKYASYQH